ncbi:MAG: hypothetical protein M1826_002793 [Phylliscum demangeonii]|nr:MAG: hypothetical protein M1826_002793 [Phylliscum demangeonii]
MILDRITILDCIVFLVLLAPQLLVHVGLLPTLAPVLRALPFLLLQLPVALIRDRGLRAKAKDSRWEQGQASLFADIVLRCVRYAFAEVPANVGVIFFTKAVALPFLRYRMLRCGHLRSPVSWQEVHGDGFTGLWVIDDQQRAPDVIVYYCHGGGFSFGTSYFYLELAITLIDLLQTSTTTTRHRFRNPAVLLLEYTLVPQATYPTQLQQTLAGYRYLLTRQPDPARICLAGDSAGATLHLSLLLHLTRDHAADPPLPRFAVLISPWLTLLSTPTATASNERDYLDAARLREYGRLNLLRATSSSTCAPSRSPADDAIASPGTNPDEGWWRRAAPTAGLAVMYGSAEILAPETRAFVALLRRAGVEVRACEEEGGLHAWPVAALFLGQSVPARVQGLKALADLVAGRVQAA